MDPVVKFRLDGMVSVARLVVELLPGGVFLAVDVSSVVMDGWVVDPVVKFILDGMVSVVMFAVELLSGCVFLAVDVSSVTMDG